MANAIFFSQNHSQFDSLEEERKFRKTRLAMALRVFGKYGFDEGVAGHFTVRDPIEPNTFWVSVSLREKMRLCNFVLIYALSVLNACRSTRSVSEQSRKGPLISHLRFRFLPFLGTFLCRHGLQHDQGLGLDSSQRSWRGY